MTRVRARAEDSSTRAAKKVPASKIKVGNADSPGSPGSRIKAGSADSPGSRIKVGSADSPGSRIKVNATAAAVNRAADPTGTRPAI